MQDKQQVWSILSSKPHPLQAEYDDYFSRNPPRQLRPVWQQVAIVLVPVAIVAGMAWYLLI
jgi:hypothetical protein